MRASAALICNCQQYSHDHFRHARKLLPVFTSPEACAWPLTRPHPLYVYCTLARWSPEWMSKWLRGPHNTNREITGRSKSFCQTNWEWSMSLQLNSAGTLRPKQIQLSLYCSVMCANRETDLKQKQIKTLKSLPVFVPWGKKQNKKQSNKQRKGQEVVSLHVFVFLLWVFVFIHHAKYMQLPRSSSFL